MPSFIRNYANKWKDIITTYSPRGWSFVSFLLPLVAVPIAVEVGKRVYKEVKKRKK